VQGVGISIDKGLTIILTMNKLFGTIVLLNWLPVARIAFALDEWIRALDRVWSE
jgi:hypothetical protein